MSSSRTFFIVTCSFVLLAICVNSLAQGRPLSSESKFQSSLRRLVHTFRSKGSAAVAEHIKNHLYRGRKIIHSKSPEVVSVEIFCDGTRHRQDVEKSLRDIGLEVSGNIDYHHGFITAHLPLSSAQALHDLPGVGSVRLALRPRFRKTISKSPAIPALGLDEFFGVLDGSGITIGVLSDSFNKLGGADTDIKAGDLPGPGNPDGRTTPVLVIEDSRDDECEDEGRAMLQLIYDIAPGARLCFATALSNMSNFHDNILRLAGPPCNADVLVDDVGYPDEPVYSDGIVSNAVDTVTAQGVAFFSAAGNDNFQTAEFLLDTENEELPDALTDRIFDGYDGWQYFGNDYFLPMEVQNYTELLVQWSDPEGIPGKVSLDLDVFVFMDKGGQLVLVANSSDDNAQTMSPSEYVELPAGVYQIAVAQSTVDGVESPFPFHYTWFYSAEPVEPDSPSFDIQGKQYPATYGHSASHTVISVATFNYWNLISPAFYSSPGPTRVFFKANGDPYLPYEHRRVPEVAGVDCTDTSFFGGAGQDAEQDGLPNFCGTSAAAPHVAATAVLLLQEAGGPRSLTPERVEYLLEKTASGGGWTRQAGYGLIDGGAAITFLRDERAASQRDALLLQLQNTVLNGNVPFNGSAGVSSQVQNLQAQTAALAQNLSAVVTMTTSLGARLASVPTSADLQAIRNELQTLRSKLDTLVTVPTQSVTNNPVALIAAFGGGLIAAGLIALGVVMALRRPKKSSGGLGGAEHISDSRFELVPMAEDTEGDQQT